MEMTTSDLPQLAGTVGAMGGRSLGTRRKFLFLTLRGVSIRHLSSV
jgi:hypothetical protein